MDPNIYLIYLLVLKYDKTIQQIFDRCTSDTRVPGYPTGPFGSTTFPSPTESECMDAYIHMELLNVPPGVLEPVFPPLYSALGLATFISELKGVRIPLRFRIKAKVFYITGWVIDKIINTVTETNRIIKWMKN